MNMLKFISKSYDGDERTYTDKEGMRYLVRIDFYWLRTILVDLIVGLY